MEEVNQIISSTIYLLSFPLRITINYTCFGVFVILIQNRLLRRFHLLLFFSILKQSIFLSLGLLFKYALDVDPAFLYSLPNLTLSLTAH